MSKIGALQWTRIGVDYGWEGCCTTWNSVRSFLAMFTSWFGLHQGWLVLTRIRYVHIDQIMTKNHSIFCFVLIIHNSTSLKSMNAASTVEQWGERLHVVAFIFPATSWGKLWIFSHSSSLLAVLVCPASLVPVISNFLISFSKTESCERNKSPCHLFSDHDWGNKWSWQLISEID